MALGLQWELGKLAEAAVALGSNLGDSRMALEQAVLLMGDEIGPVVARSGWIETAAVVHPNDPVREHPNYLNGAVVLETDRQAEDILTRLLKVERMLGRVRDTRVAPWQPREIDLDLIFLGDMLIQTESLVVPHPRMHERAFVLRPLAQIRPDWRHPVLGKTVIMLLQEVEPAR